VAKTQVLQRGALGQEVDAACAALGLHGVGIGHAGMVARKGARA